MIAVAEGVFGTVAISKAVVEVDVAGASMLVSLGLDDIDSCVLDEVSRTVVGVERIDPEVVEAGRSVFSSCRRFNCN